LPAHLSETSLIEEVYGVWLFMSSRWMERPCS